MSDEQRVSMPKELKPEFDAVQMAHDAWRASRDDFFGEADGTSAEAEVRRSVQRLVNDAAAAGVPAASVADALRKRFPEMAGQAFFESATHPGGFVPENVLPAVAPPAPVVAQPLLRGNCSACNAPLSAGAQFCHQCGAATPEPTAAELLSIIESLAAQVRQLEVRQQTHPGLPQTKILSPDFMTRAFAIYGHSMVVAAIISIPLYIVFYLLSLAMVAALG